MIEYNYFMPIINIDNISEFYDILMNLDSEYDFIKKSNNLFFYNSNNKSNYIINLSAEVCNLDNVEYFLVNQKISDLELSLNIKPIILNLLENFNGILKIQDSKQKSHSDCILNYQNDLEKSELFEKFLSRGISIENSMLIVHNILK